MTVREQPWPEGTPAWAELVAPDLDAVRRFYGPLFGWTFDVGGPETGHYTTALLGGRPVAGITPTPPDTPDAAPGWTTHLATADVQARADRAVAAGAQVLLGPLSVMDMGSMALVTDPTGATFALWQSGTRIGAEVVDEPGAMIWNEQMSPQFAEALDFYRALFDYQVEDMSQPGFEYAAISTDTGPVGGIGGDTDSGRGARWEVTFAVRDTDAAVAHAIELGGQVHYPPQDSPYGRIAGVTGPSGERFYLMSTDEESSPAAS